MVSELPKVSIVIPTLNSDKTLRECLESIKNQEYPKDEMEVLIIDGGSTDNTKPIAEKYGCRIVENPKKIGDAGKAIGIRNSGGEIIALIDSDNILPDKHWISKMVKVFEDDEISASEPIEYTWRKKDGYITRYCALIGMNDPFCLFQGNYDRMCKLTGKWTELQVEEEDRGSYLKVKLFPEEIPTIGANGFLVRRRVLDAVGFGEYFFDIDFVQNMVNQEFNKIAKVKVGIVHIYVKGFWDFIKKQRRRIRDFLFFRRTGLRTYKWKLKPVSILKFSLYTVLLVPLLLQSIEGFRKKPDNAWFFHVPACITTIVVYAGFFFLSFVNNKPESRKKW